MSGIYYLLSMIAIGLVIHWVIQNEKVGPGQQTRGWLAIRSPEELSARRAERAARRSRKKLSWSPPQQ